MYKNVYAIYYIYKLYFHFYNIYYHVNLCINKYKLTIYNIY